MSTALVRAERCRVALARVLLDPRTRARNEARTVVRFVELVHVPPGPGTSVGPLEVPAPKQANPAPQGWHALAPAAE